MSDWPLTTEQAIALQVQMAGQVIRYDSLPDPVRLVAGVDVAYGQGDDQRVFAGVVVIDVTSMKTVETRIAVATSAFPYIPGLFAFRELPPILRAFEQLEQRPDLIICDGQGVAHPRRCGLASHLGVLLDMPTVGCGKTRLIGEHLEPGRERGSSTPLVDQGEVIGSVLRTQTDTNPLYVSTGHRVSLQTAEQWILQLATTYRQPEPIRRANELVNQSRHMALCSQSEGE